MELQPTNPPPAPRPSPRISDDDRERVVVLLREHCVAGRLDFDELAQRAAAVYAARTRDDLAAVMHDLPDPAPSPPSTLTASASRTLPSLRRGVEWTVAVMSGANRRGRWRVHHETNAVSVMGGCVLDLRQAVLDGEVLVINCFALMGAVDIIVPDGIEVELSGLAVMGAKESRVSDGPPLPGTPLVRVRAFAMMGAVNVKSRPALSTAGVSTSVAELPEPDAGSVLPWYEHEQRSRRKMERRIERDRDRRERRNRE